MATQNAVNNQNTLNAGTAFSGTNVLGTANSAGISLSVGNYITTARASTDAIGLNTAQTNVTWTVNSSGISFNAGGYAGINTAMTGGSVTLNTSGISINLPAYLTTARASTDAVGLNTAKTNVTWTVNSSGISFDAGGYAGTGFTSTTTAGTAVVGTHNTAGLSMAFPTFITNALTTARASTDAVGLNTANTNVTWTVNSSGISINAGGYAGTGATTGGGVGLSVTHNTAGISFSIPTWLTTARGSTDAIGLNTAKSNVTWTVNSSGLSFDARGYAGTGTSATNATITLDSNGLAISVANPAAGVGIAAGTRSATTANNLLFDTGNGITFGLNAVGGSIMTASHNGLTTARASTDGIGLNTAQTNVTWTVNSSGISFNAIGYAGTGTTFNGTNVSGSLTQNSNGIRIDLSAPPDVTYGGFDPYPYNQAFNLGNANRLGSIFLYPISPPNFSFSRVDIPFNYTNASNSTGSQTMSVWVGLYTRNVSTLSLLMSGSSSVGLTGNGTLNASINAGVKLLSIGFTTTVTGGNYWIGYVYSSSTAGTNASISQLQMNYLTIAQLFGGLFNVASNASNQIHLGLGYYSSTAFTMPSSAAFSHIREATGFGFLVPKIIFNATNIN